MAKKKTAKNKSVSKLVAGQKKIRKELSGMEKKLLENYKAVAQASGKNWKQTSKQIKARMNTAQKKIRSEVKNNPERSAVAAAVLGAILGALAVGLATRKKK